MISETGYEVDSADIIKGYEVGKGQYIEIQPEEFQAIAIEASARLKSTSSLSPSTNTVRSFVNCERNRSEQASEA